MLTDPSSSSSSSSFRPGTLFSSSFCPASAVVLIPVDLPVVRFFVIDNGEGDVVRFVLGAPFLVAWTPGRIFAWASACVFD